MDYDALIDSWRRGPRLSEHTALEVTYAVAVGHRPGDPPPLKPGEPVPGCACPACTGIAQDHPARQHRVLHGSTSLPVEEARAVPIIDVASRLGLDLHRVGRSWRAPCPIHGGEDRNFSVLMGGGARCWSCGWTGDGIALVMELRGVEFADAVRELAGRP